jgi:hypothetical protein
MLLLKEVATNLLGGNLEERFLIDCGVIIAISIENLEKCSLNKSFLLHPLKCRTGFLYWYSKET